MHAFLYQPAQLATAVAQVLVLVRALYEEQVKQLVVPAAEQVAQDTSQAVHDNLSAARKNPG